jgi:hypothetical protein
MFVLSDGKSYGSIELSSTSPLLAPEAKEKYKAY